jgi:cation transport ATPase
MGNELSDNGALADADVSVSFAEGTDIERASADIVSIGNDLRRLIAYQKYRARCIPNISVVTAGVFRVLTRR